MHASVLAWVEEQVHRHGLADRDVLEVGALNVNGSVRLLFSGVYVGVDLRDGPGVDVIAPASNLPVADASVDVVVSTEMLEHDPTFWLSLREIARVLRPGGHLLLTTRGNGFGEHREPADYWRFMPDAMPVLAKLAACEPIETRLDPEVPGVFVHGVRA